MLDKKGTTLEHIILLRGVTPNGKNAIPKMSYLVDILIEADFQHVRTYIQSGNIILESDLSLEEIREQVHTLIKEKIGADLKMVIKNKNDFAKIVQENPFEKHYLFDRIHVILFQNDIQSLLLEKLDSEYGEEEIWNWIVNMVKKKFVSATIVFTSISLELQNEKNLIPTILKSCSALIWPCES